MTTRHNAKPRADCDPWLYGKLSDSTPTRPNDGTDAYINARVATNAHTSDDPGTTNTARYNEVQNSYGRDEDSEAAPPLSTKPPWSGSQPSYGNIYPPGRASRFSAEAEEQEEVDLTTELRSNPVQRRSKGRRREYTTDSDDGDEDLEPIMCFVPGEDLDLTVLEHYIKNYVDKTANVRPSHHPTDKSRTGFIVTTTQSLSAAILRDVRNDSRDWWAEKQTKEFRRRLCEYRESQTAQRRDRKGRYTVVTTRPQTQPRPRQDTLGTTRAYSHIDNATNATQQTYTPAAYSYQTQDQMYASSANYALTSRPQYNSSSSQPRSGSSPVMQYASTSVQRYTSDPEPTQTYSAAPYTSNRARYALPTSAGQYSPYQNTDARYENPSGQPRA